MEPFQILLFINPFVGKAKNLKQSDQTWKSRAPTMMMVRLKNLGNLGYEINTYHMKLKCGKSFKTSKT